MYFLKQGSSPVLVGEMCRCHQIRIFMVLCKVEERRPEAGQVRAEFKSESLVLGLNPVLQIQAQFLASGRGQPDPTSVNPVTDSSC